MAEVLIRVRPWQGDHEAIGDEPVQALLAYDLILDGVSLSDLAFAWARSRGEASAPSPMRVTLEGMTLDFLALRIENPPPDLRERYENPEDYLHGTDETTLLLPVTSLRVERAGAEVESA